MRAWVLVPYAALLVGLTGIPTDEANAGHATKENREQCAEFGFRQGTDAFANCMMQLSLKQNDTAPPDHFELVKRYGDLSAARRGDDRYPVCTASMMENELDTTLNKWVGPQCQMAPD